MTRKIGQLPSIIILEQRNQLIIIFCIALIAKKVLLPKVFEEFKGLGTNPDVVSLVSNWDALKILAKYIDYVGCFLTWNKAHHTGPNSRRFMREPNEHPDYSFLHNFCCHKKEIVKAGKFDIPTSQKDNCIGQIIIINNNHQANQKNKKVLKNTSLQQN